MKHTEHIRSLVELKLLVEQEGRLEFTFIADCELCRLNLKLGLFESNCLVPLLFCKLDENELLFELFCDSLRKRDRKQKEILKRNSHEFFFKFYKLP